ncbi:MAG: RNA polymerase sigma factor [Dehalococcoidia bacterium]
MTAGQSAFSRFRAGDAAAFDELVAEYTGPAYATAVRVLREPAKAEEAVQEAFVRLWQRARQFDPERGVERSWILSVVRNSAIDALRRDSKIRERSIDEGPAVYELRDPDDVWQDVLARLTGERVRSAVKELPPDQQEVVVKAYYQGIRPVDIARELDIAEGTVRSRLRLALAKLREALGPVREELTP